jgi:hypothetical protein
MIINLAVVPEYISSYDYENDKFFNYYFNLQLTDFERNIKGIELEDMCYSYEENLFDF